MGVCRWITLVAILCLGLAVTGTDVNALSPETESLLKLLEKKGVISTDEAAELAQEVAAVETETQLSEDTHYHSVQGLSERLRRIEDNMGDRDQGGAWADRITLSGVVEVEAGYENMDFGDPAVQDTETSDLALAKIQLGVDADVAKHVKGHVLFEWTGDPVDIDEAFIILDGEDVLPFYLKGWCRIWV